MRLWLKTLTLFLALSGGIESSVHAVTRTWNNSTGGNFSTAANWSPNGAPTGADIAVMRRGEAASYTVSFPGKINLPLPVYEFDQLRVGSNSVTVADSLGIGQLPGSVTLTNATTSLVGRGLVVGESDTDTASVLTTSLASLSTVAALLGDAPESSGTLNVTGGVLSVTGSSLSDDELIVGKQGYGELNISGGGRVNILGSAGSVLTSQFNRPILGNLPQSKIAIEGVGSQLNIASSLYVGFAAKSEVTVEAGALLTTGSATIGEFSSFVIVEGEGSRWENSGNLKIGETAGSGGFGLLIRDGGSVAAGGTLTVYDNLVGVDGTVEASVVNNNILAAGTSTFGGVGTLRIAGDYEQNKKLLIYVANRTSFSKLQVDGHATLDSNSSSLQVTYGVDPPIDPFEAGDEFDILDWNGTLTGTFHSLLLPMLLPNLTWNTSQLYTTGVLSVSYRGDFDLDGDVDGRDFLIWQRGGSPDPLSADDLADWQNNYGLGTLAALSVFNGGETPPANAVPEPSTWGGLFCITLFISLLHRTRTTSTHHPGGLNYRPE